MANKLSYFLNNKIQIKKQKYSLIIGSNPSSGAKSPKLWNKVFISQNSKIRMFPADVSSKNLRVLMEYLKQDDLFIGGSVTVPYKETIIKYLDDIDEVSKKIGAINTIVKKRNKLFGINTDYLGFTRSLKKMNLKKKDKILVLGCGGVGKAVITSLIENYKNNKKIFFNRSKKKVLCFLKNLSAKKTKILNNYSELQNIKNIGLVINTTSVGFDTWFLDDKKFFNLKHFSPLTDISKLTKIRKKNEKIFVKKNIEILKSNNFYSSRFFENNPNCNVFDVIHTPKNTVLMQLSSNNKKNGIEMNLDQAVYAFMKVNMASQFIKIKKIMSD